MSSFQHLKILLAGNPNCGKTSLFNSLTGLNQKVGNYAGVTVEKKIGYFKLGNNQVELIDLPGSYSLSPNSEEEKITCEILEGKKEQQNSALVIYVADSSNLKRTLLFCSQILDLGKKVIIALNFDDLAQWKGISIDAEKLAKELGVPCIKINARKGNGISTLEKAIEEQQFKTAPFSKENPTEINLEKRYKIITKIVANCTIQTKVASSNWRRKLDVVILHKYFGIVLFFGVMLLIFQAIFSLAEFPMNAIEWIFLQAQKSVGNLLPNGVLNDLLVNGIIAGLGGIVIFIPQIALLFFFLSLMEETGYMARVSYLMDRTMRKFGLSGKSMIPLISSAACAVPAIMGARTISNKKERIITILVAPLISCSARIPVYTLLISLVIPNLYFFNIISYKALVLLFLYSIGLIMALLYSLLFHTILKSTDQDIFIMELPPYQAPRWKNVGITIYQKLRVFLFEAGKIIVAISIVLWAISSYGPSEKFNQIEKNYQADILRYPNKMDSLNLAYSSIKLENSYAGIIGKSFEPLITPLGFNWKIGIGLITSFAAREVFVGTMATIYSANSDGEVESLITKMERDRNPKTGAKIYSFATGFSLMIFYAFAMQCMSTMAVAYRETGHWKWPALQLIYMTGTAYLFSYLIYTFLS